MNKINGWRAMDCAPTTGERLLLKWDGFVVIGYWFRFRNRLAEHAAEDKTWTYADDDNLPHELRGQPEAWQPLPE